MGLVLPVDMLKIDFFRISVEDGGLVSFVNFGEVKHKGFGVVEGHGEGDGADESFFVEGPFLFQSNKASPIEIADQSTGFNVNFFLFAVSGDLKLSAVEVGQFLGFHELLHILFGIQPEEVLFFSY